jgi:hypothetical protein
MQTLPQLRNRHWLRLLSQKSSRWPSEHRVMYNSFVSSTKALPIREIAFYTPVDVEVLRTAFSRVCWLLGVGQTTYSNLHRWNSYGHAAARSMFQNVFRANTRELLLILTKPVALDERVSAAAQQFICKNIYSFLKNYTHFYKGSIDINGGLR